MRPRQLVWLLESRALCVCIRLGQAATADTTGTPRRSTEGALELDCFDHRRRRPRLCRPALAVELGKKDPTIGIDLSAEKIAGYQRCIDPTGEMLGEELAAARNLFCSTNAALLCGADIIIVAVPIPVDNARKPEMSGLAQNSETVGRHMKRGAIVVYEATVCPGATDDFCVPVLERSSGRKWKEEFFIGYSPERINPGDNERTLTRLTKVVAGDTPETLARLVEVYGSIDEAGIRPVTSIKVAEAAKVFENSQRDLNITLMNELAIIFRRLGIDMLEVLGAAGTKWNFLPFRPGHVGGHCIGVDPYCLTHKAEQLGYHPQVILAGRCINDGIGQFVAEQTVKQMIANDLRVKGADVIVLGMTRKTAAICATARSSTSFASFRAMSATCTSTILSPTAPNAGTSMPFL